MIAQNLSQMRCEMTSPCEEECALRARSTHGVHHAIVEVNIVSGVVFGEVHDDVRVHVIPLCDDVAVGLTLGLIALSSLKALFSSQSLCIEIAVLEVFLFSGTKSDHLRCNHAKLCPCILTQPPQGDSGNMSLRFRSC